MKALVNVEKATSKTDSVCFGNDANMFFIPFIF